jgi:signal transduction histidine kinase/ActR/RegA family two-component response regulator
MPARSRFMAQRLADAAIAAGAMLSCGILFYIDITNPRGVMDGIGYSAVVALTSRFGKRAMIACAITTTILTFAGAALVPDIGISVGGMWANRAFALASIWVVALIMQSHMELESRIQNSEATLHRHKTALAGMVRECLLTDISLDRRLEFICRTGAQALDCSSAIIGLRSDDDRSATVLQAWHKEPAPGLPVAGTVLEADPQHKMWLHNEFTVAIEDTELNPFAAVMQKAARAYGVRATLSSEIFQDAPQSGIIIFSKHTPYRWNEEEIAFARAVANLVALLLSSQKNADTLAALDLTDDGIYTEDRTGSVQYANQTARLLAEQGPDGPIFPRPPIPLLTEHDEHAFRSGGRDLEIHRSRLATGGLIARLIDVTERNSADAERLRLEGRLKQAAKLEAIGQLASGVAHDFNNILGAITGFAVLIAQDSSPGSENHEFAQRILSASRRGKEMVEQIMTFAETRTVSHGVVNLGRAVEICRDFLVSSMRPGTKLEIQVPSAALLVRGNEVQVGQMITNLATNARDALDAQGLVEIDARVARSDEIARLRDFSNTPTDRLIGEPRPELSYALLTVRDTGHGMAPETLDRMFEPFFSTKGRLRGTGLGLAVVHGVIRSHGGFCHVISEVERGTRFDIFLPLIEEGMAAAVMPVSGEGWRVLIVDDETEMADMLSIVLERLGFATVAVQNPFPALAAIEEDPDAFDALLTDQQMPLMSGMELIQEAKRVAPRLRAVLCTGNLAEMTEAQALAGGADAVLYKPVDIQAIAEALRPRSGSQ